MKVFITERAKSDLIEIGEFIAVDNPTRALSFVEELLEKCETLAEKPLAYPLVPRFKKFAIRKRVHGNYLIFYRVRETFIEVIHILHGARDYESFLLKDLKKRA